MEIVSVEIIKMKISLIVIRCYKSLAIAIAFYVLA